MTEITAEQAKEIEGKTIESVSFGQYAGFTTEMTIVTSDGATYAFQAAPVEIYDETQAHISISAS